MEIYTGIKRRVYPVQTVQTQEGRRRSDRPKRRTALSASFSLLSKNTVKREKRIEGIRKIAYNGEDNLSGGYGKADSMRKEKWIGAVAAAMAGIGLLAGCGSHAASDSTYAQEKTPVEEAQETEPEASGDHLSIPDGEFPVSDRKSPAPDEQLPIPDEEPQEYLPPEPGKTAEELLEEEVNGVLAKMTTEEKVLQLFMITPEALTGYETVTAAGDRTRESIAQYPVGGIIYFAKNLREPGQVEEMLENTLRYYEEAGYPAPFLGIDEEGGKVARIGKQAAFGVEQIGDMRAVGEQGDPGEAARIGSVIGSYLSDLGFTLDFAPVADVLTDPDNQVIGNRSFGTDPALVADMALAEAHALEDAGVWAVLKHYPGHGATKSDSHEGYAYTDKTLEQLMEAELVPFQAGIQEGMSFIMAAHISVPEITGDDVPCSLSPYMITDVLRGKMGYDGIVVTDAMNMGAISQQYSSGDAAVSALNAGVDLLLMPVDFQSAYEGVLTAVEEGVLSQERINESVRRILRVKCAAEESWPSDDME